MGKQDDLSRWKSDGTRHPDGVLGEITEKAAYYVPPPKPIPEEGLREFILGLCDGRIFTSAHVREEAMVGMVFMPVILGMFRWHTEAEVTAYFDELGVFWEYLDKAGPTAINGYPVFMSLRALCKSDWQRAMKARDAEMERRKSIVIPPAV